ncbi:hypothetical protein BJF90_22030 [Pseudonocardia sp. CNS-004]|nr:hypothetical protein BJF90_22030 [Pseudonocardia sp. CNS-004]
MQRLAKLPLLPWPEAGDVGVLGVPLRFLRPFEEVLARLGQLDHVPPTVVGVRMTRNDLLLLQGVQERHHRRAVHSQQLRHLLLRRRLAGRHDAKHPQGARIDAEGLQRTRRGRRQLQVRVLQQVAENLGHLSARPAHARHAESLPLS